MPVYSRADAVTWARAVRDAGGRLVFTNGVFDLLHPGHIRYLAEARRLGDALIVAVNSDRSVRALAKAPDRPIYSAEERAEVLAALTSIDAVVIFDEDTPYDIISDTSPDVLVKGADWPDGSIVGADLVHARGGRVVRVPVADGYSTTRLIERIRNA